MAKRDARKHIKTPALSAVKKLLYVLILLLSFALAAGAFCWISSTPFVTRTWWPVPMVQLRCWYCHFVYLRL